jgi:hypothetical protein
MEVEGIRQVQVRLCDHFSDGEINQAMGEAQDFQQAFPGLADNNLDDLRLTFRRKAFTLRQEKLLKALVEAGLTPEEIVALRVSSVTTEADGQLRVIAPAGSMTLPLSANAFRAYLARRKEVGLAASPDAWLICLVDGSPVAAARLDRRLKDARLTRVSLEVNTAFCRGLLETRYGPQKPVLPGEINHESRTSS